MRIYYIYNLKLISDIELIGIDNVEEIPNVTDELYIGTYENNNFIPTLETKNRRERNQTEIYFETEYFVIKYNTQFEISVFTKKNQIFIKTECVDIVQTTSVLLGTGLSLYFLLRGYIPVHAGAIECNGKAVSFSGWSGVGKSSLIRYAMEQGYALVTEDTLLINNAEDILVYPTIGIKSKLTNTAKEFFNVERQLIGTRIQKTNKYWISVPKDNRALCPMKLSRMYFMEPDDSLSEVQLQELDFWEKKKRLLRNINSLNNLPVSYTVKVLKQVDILAVKLEAYIIKYPKKFEILEEIINKTTN